MTSKKDIKYTGKPLKCTACGLVSIYVHTSSKYGKNYCTECLREVILEDIKNKPY